MVRYFPLPSPPPLRFVGSPYSLAFLYHFDTCRWSIGIEWFWRNGFSLFILPISSSTIWRQFLSFVSLLRFICYDGFVTETLLTVFSYYRSNRTSSRNTSPQKKKKETLASILADELDLDPSIKYDWVSCLPLLADN